LSAAGKQLVHIGVGNVQNLPDGLADVFSHAFTAIRVLV
jgi:hypothetical protein